MVKQLEEVFDKLNKLPPDKQRYFAQLFHDEMEEERIWDELFAKSEDKWDAWMAKAFAEDDAGLTDELDPENLPD